MLTISISLFTFSNFIVIICLTRLLTFGILFSTAVNAEVVEKPLILGISVLTSFILVFRILLVAKLVILAISSSIFLILALYSVFLETPF